MNDLKFAIRQLLKNPGFTAVAVLTLAGGRMGGPVISHTQPATGTDGSTLCSRLPPSGSRLLASAPCHKLANNFLYSQPACRTIGAP